MKVQFLTRRYNYKEQSIEKLFTAIRSKLQIYGVLGTVVENPYGFGLFNILKSMLYFKKRQTGSINHIIGDMHWACLFLDRKRTVLTVHDIGRYYELNGLRKFAFYLLWIYIPVKKLKYITAISEKTKDDILKFFPNKNIHVIPNCITVPIIEETILGNNVKPKILIVGTRNNKNIENCIMALTNMKVDVDIVGELSSVQLELLKQNNIKFNSYSFIKEEGLIKLFQSADFLLFPSLFEGFGLPILEAQAQNTIVITSNFAPMNKVAGNGAIFVDPFSVESISGGVCYALNLSKEERINLLIQGKENVKFYSVQNISLQYLNIYEKMA